MAHSRTVRESGSIALLTTHLAKPIIDFVDRLLDVLPLCRLTASRLQEKDEATDEQASPPTISDKPNASMT